MTPHGFSVTGKFITFEGGEGTGKSTQIRRLADRLQSAGLDVIKTREPGGAPGAEAIRKLLVEGQVDRWDPISETLLHFAARREHWVQTIRPALERGACVLSDRFADSTMVYQALGQGVAAATVTQLYALTIGQVRPDLTLILDLPVEDGLARAAERRGAETRYERLGIDFHRKVRAGFLRIAAEEPMRCIVIDASGDVEVVAHRITNAIRLRFG